MVPTTMGLCTNSNYSTVCINENCATNSTFSTLGSDSSNGWRDLKPVSPVFNISFSQRCWLLSIQQSFPMGTANNKKRSHTLNYYDVGSLPPQWFREPTEGHFCAHDSNRRLLRKIGDCGSVVTSKQCTKTRKWVNRESSQYSQRFRRWYYQSIQENLYSRIHPLSKSHYHS